MKRSMMVWKTVYFSFLVSDNLTYNSIYAQNSDRSYFCLINFLNRLIDIIRYKMKRIDKIIIIKWLIFF